MQKRIFFIIIVISLLLFISFLFANVSFATNPDLDEILAGEEATEDNIEESEISDGLVEENELSEIDEESHDEDVYSTDEDEDNVNDNATEEAQSIPKTISTPSDQINTYRTVSTLPEANLQLNNILNIILIAVGVIIILLAISILIRIKQ